MKIHSLLMSLIGLLISAALAANSCAQVLDQRSVTPSNINGSAIGERDAQTVTVGIAGQLSHIDLKIYQSDAIASGDLVIDLFGLNASGGPEFNNLLGSVTIANSMIPLQTDFRSSGQYTTADFSSQNINFEVGDQFAILPRRTNLSNWGAPPWMIWSSTSDGSSYTAGTHYLFWQNIWGPRSGAMGFRTFMNADSTVPIPTVTFFDLSPYDGSEQLITFDDAGFAPSNTVNRISPVSFNLLDEGTRNDTGQGPTAASAPNAVYNREFDPSDGSMFINFGFDVDLELRFDNAINTVSAEIRTRASLTGDETLTFELYSGDDFVSSATVDDRGGFHFFSYGVQSTELFDRLIIRNRQDQRFDLENLRFGLIDATTYPLGDCDHNGVVNFLDIAPFISFLQIGYQREADINEDGIVDFLDINPFIAMLSGN